MQVSKAPIVVFDDADPVSAANGAAFACFVASGQTCVSGTRLIIQDKIANEFMQHFMRKVESIRNRMGNRTCTLVLIIKKRNHIDYVHLLFLTIAMNPLSTMGSVISPKHLERIEHMVQSKRKGSGRIIFGGQRLVGTSALDGFDFSKGSFFPPTVIKDVSIDDDLWREEVFGPVVVLKRFKVNLFLNSFGGVCD